MSKSRQFWDRSADNYDKTEERFEFIHSRTREKTKKYLQDTDIVLDYGCGTGTSACELSPLVKEVRGIDISPRMIELAKAKAASRDIRNIDFEQGDIFDEKYQQESFDAVLAFNMLHTVLEPQKVVQRIVELLKPGGTLVSVTPCLGGKMSFLVRIQILFVRILLKCKLIPIPIRRLRSSDLDELLEDEKLEILETEEIYKGASSYFVVAKKVR